MTDFHASLDRALAATTDARHAPSGGTQDAWHDRKGKPDESSRAGTGVAASSPGSVAAPAPDTQRILAPLTAWQWLVLVTLFYALPVSLACWWVAGLART